MRLLLAFIIWLAATAAAAGEFADSGQSLDNQLLELRQAIQELDQRLGAVEGHTHEGTEPPVEPPAPECLVMPVEAGQTPAEQHCLPVRIQAEDFDYGGQDIAYHDTTPGNAFGLARTEDVDIKATGDLDGTYQVGLSKEPEWLEYTVGVTPGVYNIHARVTRGQSSAPASIKISLGGEMLGEIAVPFTGNWDGEHMTVSLPCIPIEMTGNKILRLAMIGGYRDFNWIEFEGDKPGNDPPCDIVLEDG